MPRNSATRSTSRCCAAKVERYLVMPPFTNHSDAPSHDTAGHGNHPRPNDREAITIEPSVGGEDPETGGEEG